MSVAEALAGQRAESVKIAPAPGHAEIMIDGKAEAERIGRCETFGDERAEKMLRIGT